jgi:hypothetical protein
MERHHDAELNGYIENLYMNGFVSIPWDRLYMIFNADRLGKGAHQEIQRRYEDFCTITNGHKKAPALSIIEPGKFPYALRIIRQPLENEKIQPFNLYT